MWISLAYLFMAAVFYMRARAKAEKAGVVFAPEIQKQIVLNALVWPYYVVRDKTI
jgi:hypothetical protein